HASELLFAPSTNAVANLKREGLQDGVYLVGDVMLDAFLRQRRLVPKSARSRIPPVPYALATIHRPAGTDNPRVIARLCNAIGSLPVQVLWPVHPRTRQALKKNHIRPNTRITLVDPVGYYESIALQEKAHVILTDSGGIQKEAYFLKKP